MPCIARTHQQPPHVPTSGTSWVHPTPSHGFSLLTHLGFGVKSPTFNQSCCPRHSSPQQISTRCCLGMTQAICCDFQGSSCWEPPHFQAPGQFVPIHPGGNVVFLVQHLHPKWRLWTIDPCSRSHKHCHHPCGNSFRGKVILGKD